MTNCPLCDIPPTAKTHYLGIVVGCWNENHMVNETGDDELFPLTGCPRDSLHAAKLSWEIFVNPEFCREISALWIDNPLRIAD